MQKTYTPDQHAFFDSLVAFFASHASFAVAFAAQHTGRAEGFEDKDRIGFGGNPEVTNLAMSLAPKKLMDALSSDDWPDSIEVQLHHPPPGKPLNKLPQIPRDHKLTGMHGLGQTTVTSMFVDFYESHVGDVRTDHGGDPTGWPDVWNFARVIRNALSHGGTVEVRNSNADPVSWRGLTYSSSENGQRVLFQDLAIVDIIFLMEDMNSHI